MPDHCTRFHRNGLNAVIRVAGDDAGTYLQGQFTNDLQNKAASSVYGLWLNQKGRVLADSHVLRVADKEYVLVSRTSIAQVICRRLSDYIVADDVTLADETENFRGIGMWGPECARRVVALFGAAPAKDELLADAGCLVFAGRRAAEENFEVVGSPDRVADCCERLREMGCVEADPVDADWERLTAGIPSVPQDIGPGDLPNEGGLDEGAVSYTKGCYLGQEVMARLKNLGQVRRKLHVLRGRGLPPNSLDALFQAGKKVGEIRSVASRGGEFVALGMLSLLGLKPEAGLSLAPETSPVLHILPHG